MTSSLVVGLGVAGPVSTEWILEHYPNITKLVFAAALGMLLGIEREWSRKPVGVRSFTFTAVIAAALTLVEQPILLLLGGLLIVLQGGILGIRGLISNDDSDFLTTGITLLVAFVIGILIGSGMYFEGIVTGLLVSSLLVLGRELHTFAWNLSKNELRSAIEFGVIAFVVYPLLPDTTFGPWNAINPRTVWILVVAVSAIGFVNYLLVQRYGTRGIAMTSFFGGLVSSTAVIGEMMSRTRENPSLDRVAVGAILLADAAMAFRDTIIVIAFIPELAFSVGIPLVVITVVGIVLSYVMSDWGASIEMEFESPFKLKNALEFSGLFLLVLLVTAGSEQFFGSSGVLVSSFISGLVSSGAVTTTVVILFGNGQITQEVASAGILTGVTASILVKLVLAASMDRSLVRPATIGSILLIVAGFAAAVSGLQFAL